MKLHCAVAGRRQVAPDITACVKARGRLEGDTHVGLTALVVPMLSLSLVLSLVLSLGLSLSSLSITHVSASALVVSTLNLSLSLRGLSLTHVGVTALVVSTGAEGRHVPIELLAHTDGTLGEICGRQWVGRTFSGDEHTARAAGKAGAPTHSRAGPNPCSNRSTDTLCMSQTSTSAGHSSRICLWHWACP